MRGRENILCLKILNLNEVAQKIVTMSTQVSFNVFYLFTIKRKTEEVELEVKDLSVLEYKSRMSVEKDGRGDWERRRSRTSDLRQGKTDFLREERKWYQCDGSIGKWERCFGMEKEERSSGDELELTLKMTKIIIPLIRERERKKNKERKKCSIRMMRSGKGERKTFFFPPFHHHTPFLTLFCHWYLEKWLRVHSTIYCFWFLICLYLWDVTRPKLQPFVQKKVRKTKKLNRQSRVQQSVSD